MLPEDKQTADKGQPAGTVLPSLGDAVVRGFEVVSAVMRNLAGTQEELDEAVAKVWGPGFLARPPRVQPPAASAAPAAQSSAPKRRPGPKLKTE